MSNLQEPRSVRSIWGETVGEFREYLSFTSVIQLQGNVKGNNPKLIQLIHKTECPVVMWILSRGNSAGNSRTRNHIFSKFVNIENLNITEFSHYSTFQGNSA